MTHRLVKTIFIGITISILFSNQTDAYCARCKKIEEERARQQAKNPQSVGYYDDQIGLHTSNNLTDKSEYGTHKDSGEDRSQALRKSDYRPSSETNQSVDSINSQDLTQALFLNKKRLNPDILVLNGNDEQPEQEEFFEESTVPNVTDAKSPNNHNREFELRGSSYKHKPYSLSIPSKAYSTIYTIFKTRNFLETLDGAFTLFIPSNEALQQLSSETLIDLTRPENEEKLAALISNHLLAKKLLKKDFTEYNDSEIKAISGKNLTLSNKSGKLFIDDAQILQVEPAGYDGVIYVIDKVLGH